MKKLLSVLLALSLMVSMLTVGTFAADTDTTNPAIVSVVAINDTQFRVTTSQPVTMNGSGWGLFISADGTNVASLASPDRYGLHLLEEYKNTAVSEFIVAVDVNSKGELLYDAGEVINGALEAGKHVYLGINGAKTGEVIDAERACNADKLGFISNLTNSSHGIHAIAVEAYTPLTIKLVKVLNATQLEVEFSKPIATYDDGLFVHFGLMNAGGTDLVDVNGEDTLDNTWELTNESIVDGKLVCDVTTTKSGMTAETGGRDLYKVIAALETAYPDYVLGIRILEQNDDSIKGTGFLENVKSEDGSFLLKGTAALNSRDIAAAPIAMGVAKVEDTICYSVDEAKANANSGDTIVLTSHVTIDDSLFVVDADVTLDLNGHTLTANNVMAFGDVIDSTEGAGKLATPAAGRVILKTNNSAMPLYDTDNGCYRFYTYTLAAAGPKDGTADAVSFGVQITFKNTDAYALLAQDANATVDMALSVTKDEKVTNLTVTFSRATLTKYNTAWTDPDRDTSKTPTLVLTVSGLTGTDSISCTPSINQSTTTVSQSGSELTYPVNA